MKPFSDKNKAIHNLRFILGFNILQIAEIFKVKRETIYKWMNGKTPLKSNLEKLKLLHNYCLFFKNLCHHNLVGNRFLNFDSEFYCASNWIDVPINNNNKSLLDLFSEKKLNHAEIENCIRNISIVCVLIKIKQRAHDELIKKHGFKEPTAEQMQENLHSIARSIK
jgi:transcriptional regulator with XRE-family HTH domain